MPSFGERYLQKGKHCVTMPKSPRTQYIITYVSTWQPVLLHVPLDPPQLERSQNLMQRLDNLVIPPPHPSHPCEKNYFERIKEHAKCHSNILAILCTWDSDGSWTNKLWRWDNSWCWWCAVRLYTTNLVTENQSRSFLVLISIRYRCLPAVLILSAERLILCRSSMLAEAD